MKVMNHSVLVCLLSDVASSPYAWLLFFPDYDCRKRALHGAPKPCFKMHVHSECVTKDKMVLIITYSFMCYFSTLERVAHYIAKN